MRFAVVVETGVLDGKTRRAWDSVVLEDAVATQETVTQLIAVIRRAGREVSGAAELVAAECRGHDDTNAGKPAIAWQDKQARDELVLALVADATTSVEALGQAELDEAVA